VTFTVELSEKGHPRASKAARKVHGMVLIPGNTEKMLVKYLSIYIYRLYRLLLFPPGNHEYIIYTYYDKYIIYM